MRLKIYSVEKTNMPINKNVSIRPKKAECARIDTFEL